MKYNYNVSKYNIKLNNSSLLTKNEVNEAITEIHHNYKLDDSLVNFRTRESLLLEWAGHKLLYKLGLYIERTKDVDWNYPLSWKEKIAWNILGIIGLIIFK